MPDLRTPEQRAAADNLIDAIQQVIRLREVDEDMVDPGTIVVTDFLVVAACDSIELMERSAVQYAYLTKNDGEGHDATPAHSLVGLAHMALDWFA